ncbi:hypothetical protein ACFST9_04235 [Hymenobacter monticola]|uniref:Uncharacterized protein n=1 Tax=Hymenobacter monticola TaxID=1705399 RepID=A0ABY4B3A4_9BACT|nr:hypothetical protein [Hymenobacter monticola]UOE32837.1 hypothetical protein MTP16_17085 [Hymenobacter monticola]
MSYNYLNNGYDNRPIFNIPGAKRLFMIKKENLLALGQSPGLLNGLSNYLIEDISIFGKWNIFNELDNFKFDVKLNRSKAGDLYSLELGFSINMLTRDKNTLLENLLNTDVTVMIQDENDRFWLLGDEQPLRMSELGKTIDGEVNQYTVKLEGRQLKMMKEVGQIYIITLTEVTDMVDSTDGGAVTWVLNTGGSTGPITGGSSTPSQQLNILSSVTNPPNGYTIRSIDHVILVGAGRSINLPSSPVQGQEHILKDYSGGASLLPITVNGNGKLIDGYSTASINTDFGALTFIYGAGGWNTTAFVN